MRHAATLSALLLTSLSLAGCSGGGNGGGGGDAGDAGAGGGGGSGSTNFDPSGDCGGSGILSVGDFWEFDTTTSGSGFTFTSESRVEVKTISNVDAMLEGTLSTRASGTSTTADIEQHMCPGSLAIKSVKTSGSVSGYSYSSTATYDPPCNGMKLPVAVGQDYSYTCHAKITGQTNAEYDQETHVKVLGKESVTIPAGTFTAYKIEVTITQDDSPSATQTWYYADKACTSVKISGANEDGSGSYELTLTDYKCGKGS